MLWPRRVSTSVPLEASHTFTVWSSLPVASRLPSGLQATRYTGRLWPRRVSNSVPLEASHTCTVCLHCPSLAACRPGSRPRYPRNRRAREGSGLPSRSPRPTPSPSCRHCPSPAAYHPGSRPRWRIAVRTPDHTVHITDVSALSGVKGKLCLGKFGSEIFISLP